MQQKITIALDMMSGDHSVSSSVPAATESLEKFNDLYLILVGDQNEINSLLPDKIKLLEGSRYRIVHTDEYIKTLKNLDLKLVKVVDTHIHADHISG